MVFLDKVKRLELDRRYPHVVKLPRHPDHPLGQRNGDPRKAWLYDGVATGGWHVDEQTSGFSRYTTFQDSVITYRFSHEYDAVIFRLKWA